MLPTETETALYLLLGRRIADARSKRAEGFISQAQLARMVGLARGSIANLELGSQRAPLHVICAIGAALGVEPRTLIPTSGELEAFCRAEYHPNSEGSADRPIEKVDAWIAETESSLRGAPSPLRKKGASK